MMDVPPPKKTSGRGENNSNTFLGSNKEYAVSFGAAGSYDAGASTAINSSSAHLKNQMKKVLTFRLFKRLKEVKDLNNMFEIDKGQPLGKGSFGEVRKCVNR